MKTAIITVNDEVHSSISGLEKTEIDYFWDKFGVEVEGSRFMPARKLGRWDGKIRFFEKPGKIFLRLLDDIIPVLEKRGYEIELVDNRKAVQPITKRLTTDYFNGISSVPIQLRQYQVEAVNTAIQAGSGACVMSTGSGKTLCIAGLVHILGCDNLKSMTIVPSADLVQQTSNTFDLCNIEHGIYSGAEKNVQAQHVIGTWQAIQNNPSLIKSFDAVIVDECIHPDSLISTSVGDIPIKDIKIGDSVLTLNEVTKCTEFKPVKKVHHNLSVLEKKFKIKLDNTRELIITGNHKVLTNRGWVRADSLKKDDELL